MRIMLRSLLPLVALIAVTGCAAQDNDPIVGAADSNLVVQAEFLGSIRNGETKTGEYSGGPANRAFGFRATGNDTIRAEVTMLGGDAEAFLTSENFTVLASGSGGSGPDASATFTVPAGPSRPMRLAFHNAAAPSGNFKVKLSITPGACTGQEPWFEYVAFTAADCETIAPQCNGRLQFMNACGCGCERPQ